MVGGDAALVVLVAAAGYGKSTLAQQCIQADARVSTHLVLRAADNDPVLLLRRLVTALDAAAPVPAALREVRPRTARTAAMVVPILAEALERGPDRLLVLDDLHVVDSTGSVGLLNEVLDVIPTGSTVVVATRSAPAIHLTRRSLDRRVVVLGRDDLAFDDDEAQEVLARIAPTIGDVETHEMIERIAGWPAGLHLAAMAVDGLPHGADVIRNLPDVDRRVVEYLREEVLDSLEPDDRSFLVACSVLDEMTGTLCDAVVDATGGGERLARLSTTANLFVAGHGDRGWYRCHELFREMLLAELRSNRGGDEVLLRRRAARWLTEHDLADDAIAQASAAGDVELAAEVLTTHLVEVVETGLVETLGRWLDRFDAEAGVRYPEIMVARGWYSLFTGDIGMLRSSLSLLAEQTRGWMGLSPDASPALRGNLDGLCMLTGFGGTKATVEAAARITADPPTATRMWPTAMLVRAMGEHVLGLLADPRDRLRDVELASRGHATTHVVTLSQLAVAEIHAGRRSVAFDLVDRAVSEVLASGLVPTPMCAPLDAAVALVDAHRSRPTSWRAAVDRCRADLDLMRGSVTRSQVHLRLVLVEAALAGNDTDLAREILDEVPGFFEAEPDVVVVHDRYDELVAVLNALRPPRGVDHSELTPAELRVLRGLATHMSLQEIGDSLFVSRNTVKSHTGSIYRKFGVSGRSAAVEHGRATGLLSG